MLGLGLGFTSESVLRRAGGVTYAWTPLDLGTSLKAWWNADDHGTGNMTDDGAGVISSWKDRVGGLAATGTTTERPTWAATSTNSAYPGVTFDGVANVLHAATVGSLPVGATAGQVWMSGMQNAPLSGTLRCLFTYGAGSGARITYSSFSGGINIPYLSDEVTANRTNAGVSLQGNFILGGNWSPTLLSGRQNGTAFTSTSAMTLNTATTGLGIGARWYTAASSWASCTLRHLIVTTDLTLAQQQQMEGFFAWENGTTAILPAGHPYKAAAPTVVRAWTPLDLGASLKAWWNADDHGTARMVDDGAGLISSWTDRVSAIAATGITTARPTWAATSFNSAYAGLTFDGVANRLTTTTYAGIPTGTTASETHTVCSYGQPGTTAGFQVVFTYGTAANDRQTGRFNVTNVSRGFVSESLTANIKDTVYDFTGPGIVSGSWAGVVETLWMNGLSAGTVAITSVNTPAGTLAIGSRSSAAAFWPALSRVRHIFVTLTLSTTDRDKLIGWAAWDSNLASLLPAGHPYKSVRP